MTVSKRTRFEVLRRDDYTCRYCRSRENELTIDHVVPAALGGSDAPENLVACCKDCNTGKSSSAPNAELVGQVEDDAARWLAARKRAAEKLAAHAERWSDEHANFKTHWFAWDKTGEHLPTGWRQSINTWLDSGLTGKQVHDAHLIAIGKRHISHSDVFRYMAGILKSFMVELDEATRAELAKEPNDG